MQVLCIRRARPGAAFPTACRATRPAPARFA